MTCYKDMFFCTVWGVCKNGYNCERALTPQVKSDAESWMHDSPIQVYSGLPKCFVAFFDNEKEPNDGR